MDSTNENAYSVAEELVSRMIDYEVEYFDDMRMDCHSIVRPFLVVQNNRPDGTIDYVCDSPAFEDDLQLFEEDDSLSVRIVEQSDNTAGCFTQETNEIDIDPSEAQNKSVILHEMIHAHEYKLSSVPSFYRDIIMLCLYNDLLPKIPNLDDRIIAHTHVAPGDRITAEGGSHDILFFLKSLDLDLRCGYKLGTVCGYGRDEM